MVDKPWWSDENIEMNHMDTEREKVLWVRGTVLGDSVSGMCLPQLVKGKEEDIKLWVKVP
jgi:hypothetical protein